MKAKRFTTLLVSGVLAASMLVGCGGINKNETVATLDGQEIKLGVANFAARLQQAEADDFYRAYFGDDVWSSDLYNNGTTMEDNTKNSVIEMIENLYILQNHMADYDVTLTDDETAKIAEVAAQFMADNDDKAINALGATEDIVKEYLTLVTVQSKMRAAIVADADTNVSDADANTSAYSYVNVSKTSYKDADGNTQEYTDDEKAELADTVQKFHDAAADTTLDTAADEYGYTVSTGTFSSDNTTLDEEVLNALEGLKSEGELSDVVETDNYYYVLRLDEITDADATEEHRQEIISQRQSDLYNEVLQGWKDEAEWVLKDKVWDKVTFDNLFTTTVESNRDNRDYRKQHNRQCSDREYRGSGRHRICTIIEKRDRIIRGSIQLWRLSCFLTLPRCAAAQLCLCKGNVYAILKKDVYQQLRRADIAENRSVHALRKKE